MTVPKPERLRIDNLPTVFPNAAGLDIGSAEIVAALPPDRDVTVVRTFTTFTADLTQLVTWLLDHHIDTVAIAYASYCTSLDRCERFSIMRRLFDNLTPLAFCGGLGPGSS